MDLYRSSTEEILSIAYLMDCSLYSAGLWPLRLISVRQLSGFSLSPAVSIAYSTYLITGTFLIFRLFTGFCGAAFLSVAGGSVSDLFSDRAVSRYENSHEVTGWYSSAPSPMAVYTVSPFLGPVIGPLISG